MSTSFLNTFCLLFAQVQVTTLQQFKALIGTMGGIIIMVSWLLALLAYFVGVSSRENNPAVSKAAFYMVWGFAIGGPFVTMLYTIIVGSDATPVPTFN